MEKAATQPQQELPGLKGYSEASIKMMRTFYEEWKGVFENRQLPIDDFSNQLATSGIVDKIDIRHRGTKEAIIIYTFNLKDYETKVSIPQ
ncbi:MAG: hypothetical protein IJ612_01170 [Prevotella sp.]|nr:hypothetical protein [Prevotella sp.]